VKSGAGSPTFIFSPATTGVPIVAVASDAAATIILAVLAIRPTITPFVGLLSA
jgi:hypothetical protein